MEYSDLLARARAVHLDIFGAFHPNADDRAPVSARTLVLLGPLEPGFWAAFTKSPEYLDGQPDPVDRWSIRVVGGLAKDLNAEALFPFGGPPYQPFLNWAVRSGRAWASPIGPLVHDTAGLMVSYRGALALYVQVALPEVPSTPCETCADQPCLSACPVGAFTGDGYNLDMCHAYLDTDPGQDCMTRGCAARRACPVSQTYGRAEAQSALHMRSFHH